MFLHLDCGNRVWWGAEGKTVECTGLNPSDFARQVKFEAHEVVRILGGQHSAGLVACLWPRLGRRLRLLVSPHLMQLPDDGLEAIQQLRMVSETRCLGEIFDADYALYASCLLRVAVEAGALWAGEPPVDLLRRHPVWPALSFIPWSDKDSAAYLVAEILEPRWFRHPWRPNRLTRLFSFLGLTADNADAFLLGGSTGRHYERAAAVFRTWSVQMDEASKGLPGAFLWRVFEANGLDASAAQGLLRASRCFVRFLHAVWSQERSDRHLFAPEMFFKYDWEADAYTKHRRRLVEDFGWRAS